MSSLETIQVVTNETLARVKDIQDHLRSMTTQLDSIMGAIQTLDCHTAADTLNTPVAKLRVRLSTFSCVCVLCVCVFFFWGGGGGVAMSTVMSTVSQSPPFPPHTHTHRTGGLRTQATRTVEGSRPSS